MYKEKEAVLSAAPAHPYANEEQVLYIYKL